MLRFYVAFFFSLGLLSAGGAAALATGEPPPGPHLTVVDDGFEVLWRTPQASLTTTLDGSARVQMAGYAQTEEAGMPVLPVAAILVALPHGATPALQEEPLQTQTLALPAALSLAPRQEAVVEFTADGLAGGAYAPSPPTAPADTGQRPLAALQEVGVVRGVRLARLLFYPVRSLTASSVSVTVAARIHVQFHTAGLEAAPAAPDDALLRALRHAVANPQQLQAGRQPLQGPPLAPAGPAVHVEVAEHGLTAITYEALAATGFAVATVDPHRLQLSRDGAAVPMEWQGDGDARFEAGERLLFYAAPRFSRWTETDAYQLREQSVAGSRMDSRAAAPAGLPSAVAYGEQLLEENRLYMPDCLCGALPAARDGDRWVWDDLRRPGGGDGAYAFALPSVAGGHSASLTLWLVGFTSVPASPDHRVAVSVNGTRLGEIAWDGKSAITETLPIPAGALRAGHNDLALSLPGLPGVAVDGVWLDAASLVYPRGAAPAGEQVLFHAARQDRAYTVYLRAAAGARVYDVTAPDQPLRLTGVQIDGSAVIVGSTTGGTRQILVAAGDTIASPTAVRLHRPLASAALSGADYIMIAPPEFIPALASLKAYREAQGLTVAVEDVRAIYDAFGGGRAHPQAIRDYLAFVYNNWTPRPQYVLLVGDGSSDPRQYQATTPVTWIPPYLADVDPWLGETAADNRYATVDGADRLPDLLVGRLPVGSAAELQQVVDKIVRYEARPPAGAWNSRLALVADNLDAAGDFSGQLDRLAGAMISAPWRATSLYLQPEQPLARVQTAIQQTWHEGAGAIVYAGHSSVHQWAAERLLHLEDVARLHNSGRLPVVLQMTCFTGSFHLPAYPSLDEALLRRAAGGAVAVWGPTGLGVATGHEALLHGFVGALLHEEASELGILTLLGKLNLITLQPAHGDLLDTFTLLGDPATRFNLDFSTPAAPLYLPVVRS